MTFFIRIFQISFWSLLGLSRAIWNIKNIINSTINIDFLWKEPILSQRYSFFLTYQLKQWWSLVKSGYSKNKQILFLLLVPGVGLISNANKIIMYHLIEVINTNTELIFLSGNLLNSVWKLDYQTLEQKVIRI